MTEELANQLQRIRIIPVRHYSPAAARAVEREIAALRPRLVLIEGPSDANPLIPLLIQPDTRPPVAILAYRPARGGEEPRTLAVPFCDYSPELVAMKAAARIGASARFFDAPAGVFFDMEGEEGAGAPEESLPDGPAQSLFQGLAERLGYSSHDEMWDSRIEMASPDDAVELIGAYGEMVRDWFAEGRASRELDRTRESWMLREIASSLEAGFRPQEIAVVCGAAHMGGLREAVVDTGLLSRARSTLPARFALIPYSFPRLSEQSGYGAGNRAPAFYQELWAAGGDWNRTALDFLLRLMKAMRGSGHALSLADTIEAERLAVNLAGLRDKPAAGLEELRDAAIASYGKGTTVVEAFLSRLLIGEKVGSVSSMADRTALQQEFQDLVKRHGVPLSDSPRDLRLNLTSPGERATSSFLHRLGTAGVPFARLAAASSSTARSSGEDTDSLARLRQMKEKWAVQWSPSTDIRLIELSPQGNTLAEVCARMLRGRLTSARNLEEAAGVLLEVVVGDLEGLYEEVLSGCERASSEDEDFSSLARVCYLLDGLGDYQAVAARRELMDDLAERVFRRACLLLPAAAGVADEEAARMMEGVKLLHQVGVRRRRRGRDMDLLVERLGRTAEGDDPVHPSAAGLASAILYLEGHTDDGGLANSLEMRLSRGEEPLRAAQFVEGLFSLNRSVLVRNRAVVGALTGFLSQMDRKAFVALLPVLRRSLGGLNQHETGYLLATIAAVLGIDPAKMEDKEASTPDIGLEELAALDQEIGDLFG